MNLSLTINNISIYFNIESRSGYHVPTDSGTETGLDMERRGNKFWNITETWNVVIKPFIEYSMWLYTYFFLPQQRTEDHSQLKKALTWRIILLEVAQSRSAKEAIYLGILTKRSVLRNDYTRSVINQRKIPHVIHTIIHF